MSTTRWNCLPSRIGYPSHRRGVGDAQLEVGLTKELALFIDDRDFVEAVAADDDDVVVGRRIELLGGVLARDGVAYGVKEVAVARHGEGCLSDHFRFEDLAVQRTEWAPLRVGQYYTHVSTIRRKKRRARMREAARLGPVRRDLSSLCM
jgi:hypothetical protein